MTIEPTEDPPAPFREPLGLGDLQRDGALTASRISGLIERVGDAVSLDADGEDERLRKAIMTSSVYLICVGGTFWAVTYAALGLWRSAVIPFAYVALSLINIAYLYRSKRDRFFLLTQLFLILMLPFLLQWSAGGFVASGAVMLWAILAPVGALMFHGIRESTRWFVAYLGLVAVSVVVDVPLSETAPEIPVGMLVAFFAVNVIMVSSIMFLLLRHFVGETEEAKRRSEGLLLSILPAAIAGRLKQGETQIADRLETVSIVFADIVNFTPLSENLDPEVLVGLLNEIYTEFDVLADSLGLEKIKTVGDAYIAISGLPTARKDHAEAAAEMALAMRDHLADIRTPNSDQPIEMRFGIHCGPVVAGVIGTQKLSYSVWGDTVNVASRMETQSLPSHIHVSHPVYRLLSAEYEFQPRGKLEIKGKGEMETYFLTGRQESTASRDESMMNRDHVGP